jgi:hypothetical protein
MKDYQKLAAHFETLHNNPPAPFNPLYNPNSKKASLLAVQSMQSDGFYDNNTREQCSIEYRKRYDNFINQLGTVNNE